MDRPFDLHLWYFPAGLGRSLTGGPDYAGLVWVLTRLTKIPGATRRTVLNHQEARCIRLCGFSARAHTSWTCPPLPHHLVADNPLLRHLSDRPDLLPNAGKPTRWAQVPYAFSELEVRMAHTLSNAPGYGLTRRQLQQRFWRLGAQFFDYVLGSLLSEGRITEYRGWLYGIPRGDFKPVGLFNDDFAVSKGVLHHLPLQCSNFRPSSLGHVHQRRTRFENSARESARG